MHPGGTGPNLDENTSTSSREEVVEEEENEEKDERDEDEDEGLVEARIFLVAACF